MASRAGAHGLGEQAIPDSPGIRVGAAAAFSSYDADDHLPWRQLPGVVLTGLPGEDRTDARLEHGTVEVGWRINEVFGASAAMGWHGDGDSHWEVAWLTAGLPWPGGDWTLGVGRRHVPMGPVLDAAGNFDRFGLMPLAKRAAVNDDWIEDGANLRWVGHGQVPVEVDLGLWSGKPFPGDGNTSIYPQLHVGADLGALRLDGFLARVSADGRGTDVRRTDEGGHSHGAPSCNDLLAQVVCFDGDTDLAGASVRWSMDTVPLDFMVGALYRRDQGDLYSISANSRYLGRTMGGWLEAVWSFRPDWTGAMRLEGMEGRNTLRGHGASLMALELGLLPEPGLNKRATMTLAWAPVASLSVAAEAGREWNDLAGNDFVGMRLIWRDELRYAFARHRTVD